MGLLDDDDEELDDELECELLLPDVSSQCFIFGALYPSMSGLPTGNTNLS